MIFCFGKERIRSLFFLCDFSEKTPRGIRLAIFVGVGGLDDPEKIKILQIVLSVDEAYFLLSFWSALFCSLT